MLHQGSPLVLLNKQKHNHLIKWFDGVIREIKLIRLARHDFHILAFVRAFRATFLTEINRLMHMLANYFRKRQQIISLGI